MKRKISPWLGITAIMFVLMQLMVSCANIIPPGGGPKDSLPPVLIKAVPNDSSLNVKTMKITLTFDEFVQLDNNMNEQLVVSPYPTAMPIVLANLSHVTIKLKDSLQPNTTYSINFGNGLKDVNESNINKQFTYVFSTGDKLDEGTLSGNIILAQTGKPDSTLVAMLYNNLNDTAVKKINPRYITKLDKKGNFTFHNLKPGTYNIFAISNEFSKKYDDSTKSFAFLNAPVEVSEASVPVKLYAYQEAKREDKKSPSSSTPASSTKPDKKKKEATPVKYTTKLESGTQDLLSNFEIDFDHKMKSIDTSKIAFTDTSYKPISKYSFVVDTSGKKIVLQHTWKEMEMYKLIIQKDAFIDSAGNELFKTDTIVFRTKKELDYGSIRLHFNNLDFTKNPVLQLVQNNKIVDSSALNTKEFFRQLYKPGEYEIRVLYDDNKDGTWTPGSYALKREPELVDAIERKATVKANNDTEIDINL
jgi:hypothetical protein